MLPDGTVVLLTFGTGIGSALFADGVLDIQEVEFQGINHISVPFSATFTPSGGTYFLGCAKYPKCKGTREATPELLEQLQTPAAAT